MNSHRIPLALAFALAVAACTSAQPEFVRPAGAPTFPPTQFVEMLEAAPSRPYVEIGVIDVPGEPGVLRTQALAQIRAKAQQIGADAVILQDLSRTAPASQRLNPTTGQMEATGGQVIPAFKGVAIKFK
ncbi:MAG: hypothetical protein U1F15_01780 [Burkholderiales bacterium]